MNGSIDRLHVSLNRKLDDMAHQLRILVENTHQELAGANSDAHQMLKESDERLEVRISRLEETVGLTAA